MLWAYGKAIKWLYDGRSMRFIYSYCNDTQVYEIGLIWFVRIVYYQKMHIIYGECCYVIDLLILEK